MSEIKEWVNSACAKCGSDGRVDVLAYMLETRTLRTKVAALESLLRRAKAMLSHAAGAYIDADRAEHWKGTMDLVHEIGEEIES